MLFLILQMSDHIINNRSCYDLVFVCCFWFYSWLWQMSKWRSKRRRKRLVWRALCRLRRHAWTDAVWRCETTTCVIVSYERARARVCVMFFFLYFWIRGLVPPNRWSITCVWPRQPLRPHMTNDVPMPTIKIRMMQMYLGWEHLNANYSL